MLLLFGVLTARITLDLLLLGFYRNDITLLHVLPEYFVNHPDEFEKIRNEYDLEHDFSVNSWKNWVLSHNGCNIRKSDELFPKTTLLFYLALVRKKLPEVTDVIKHITRTRQKDKFIATLGAAIETNAITEDDVVNLLEEMEYERTRDEPLVLVFHLLIEDLPEFDVPDRIIEERYAVLCDWLEEDLMTKIKSISSFPFHYAESSSRDGESLSVALVFPDLTIEEINKLDLENLHGSAPWWNLLEPTNFYDIYGVSYKDS